jgi:hypothetical protein
MRHKQVYKGDVIKPRMADEGGYIMECCDCSLVHRLDFSLNSNIGPVDPREIRLELRVYRDNEKTAEARAARPAVPYDPPDTWRYAGPKPRPPAPVAARKGKP